MYYSVSLLSFIFLRVFYITEEVIVREGECFSNSRGVTELFHTYKNRGQGALNRVDSSKTYCNCSLYSGFLSRVVNPPDVGALALNWVTISCVIVLCSVSLSVSVLHYEQQVRHNVITCVCDFFPILTRISNLNFTVKEKFELITVSYLKCKYVFYLHFK